VSTQPSFVVTDAAQGVGRANGVVLPIDGGRAASGPDPEAI